MQTFYTDSLVIGAGLAGSAYALQAAKAGLSVELLSLEGPLVANSDWAQGGIIYHAPGEAPEQLVAAILTVGGGFTTAPAVVIDPPPPTIIPAALSNSRVPALFVSGPAGQTQEVQYADALGSSNTWFTLTNIGA